MQFVSHIECFLIEGENAVHFSLLGVTVWSEVNCICVAMFVVALNRQKLVGLIITINSFGLLSGGKRWEFCPQFIVVTLSKGCLIEG